MAWECAICKLETEVVQTEHETCFKCPRCGEYRGDREIGWEGPQDSEHQVKLSGWVQEQNGFGVAPVITPTESRRIRAMRLPGLRYRADKALRIIVIQHPQISEVVNINSIIDDKRLQGASYSSNRQSLMVLVSILIDEGCLRPWEKQILPGTTAVSLTAKGFLAAEALGTTMLNVGQGFVAMSFSDELRGAWLDGFDPAIRAAGYSPMRIDAKDYAGGVMDEIIAEIRRSRFVIADCTQQRNGVYFEAGFAIGLGLTVIPTCRADDMKNRHFDIQHLNTLEWKAPEELATTLSKRILAVVGPGPDLPPR